MSDIPTAKSLLESNPQCPHCTDFPALLDHFPTTADALVKLATLKERERVQAAAHAPVHPQEWFKPVTKYDGVKPSDMMTRFGVNWSAVLASKTTKQTLLQWPYAWADAMLATRTETTGKEEGV